MQQETWRIVRIALHPPDSRRRSPAKRIRVGLSVWLLAAAGVQGCGAGWHRVPPDAPQLLRASQQVRVWHGAGNERWHGLELDADSISGIPFHQQLNCSGCRVAVPRSAIDSIQIGNPEAGVLKTAGLLLGIAVGWGIIYCVPGDPHCFGEGD